MTIIRRRQPDPNERPARERNKAVIHHQSSVQSDAPAQPHVSGFSNFDPQHLTPAQVIQLQRTIGNAATVRLLRSANKPKVAVAATNPIIQRLPTTAVIKSVVGEAKKDKTFAGRVVKEESTRYKAVLSAFDAYNGFLDSLASLVSLRTLSQHYTNLQDVIQKYINSKKTGNKVAYFRHLLTKINQESAFAQSRLTDFQQSGLRKYPTWKELIGTGINAVIKDKDITGSDKGGTHSVEKTNVRGQLEFYKSTVNEVPIMDVMNAKNFAPNIIKGSSFEGMDTNAIQNAYNVPDYAGMFDRKQVPSAPSSAKANEILQNQGVAVDVDLRLANRDVATARLGQILGSDVIAHAELAYRRKGKTWETGSLMEAAKGKQQDKLQFAAAAGGKDTVSWEDPNLQRLLSRLQLIDALSGQVDRNMSNFFIQIDDAGNVTGLTGIDNDMAFGKNRNDINFKFNYPGISAYVDAELARRIIALDPRELNIALGDLLNKDELGALTTRLTLLKTHLQDLQTRHKLLEPNQWDKASATGMLQEDSSYYANLHKHREG